MVKKRSFIFPKPRKRIDEKKKRNIIICSLLILILIYLFLFSRDGLLDIVKYQRLKSRLDKEINEEHTKQERIKRLIENLSDTSSTYTLEHFIREKTGRARKNEKVYRFE